MANKQHVGLAWWCTQSTSATANQLWTFLSKIAMSCATAATAALHPPQFMQFIIPIVALFSFENLPHRKLWVT